MYMVFLQGTPFLSLYFSLSLSHKHYHKHVTRNRKPKVEPAGNAGYIYRQFANLSIGVLSTV